MDTDIREHVGGERKRLSLAGSLVGFAIFTGVALAVLGAAVLLPEYAATCDLRQRRDAVARQLECDRKLTAYNDRLIWALENDPILLTRLMIRQSNYRLAGSRPIDLPGLAEEVSVPLRLLREARARPAAGDDGPRRGARMIEHRPTRTALALLGGGMLVAGVILFGAHRRRRRLGEPASEASSPTG